MRDTVAIVHRTAQGAPGCLLLLTFDFQEEAGQWVGVCQKLGTAAQSDTLERVREELREAVELQLGEMERLCGAEDFQDYLAENQVRILPITPVEKLIGQRRKMTPEQIARELKELEKLGEVGRRWREEHFGEYDPTNPPSKILQDEIYDEDGLPI